MERQLLLFISLIINFSVGILIFLWNIKSSKKNKKKIYKLLTLTIKTNNATKTSFMYYWNTFFVVYFNLLESLFCFPTERKDKEWKKWKWYFFIITNVKNVYLCCLNLESKRNKKKYKHSLIWRKSSKFSKESVLRKIKFLFFY